MGLTPGTRFGSYEVVSALGVGGMGEVYRAHDSRLRRDVALKVLPTVVAEDADRHTRFRREAQVLASLNHRRCAGSGTRPGHHPSRPETLKRRAR